MTTSDKQEGATRFDLALNTWFFVLLHEHPVVGGLPTDFLSQGAAALLVFDGVVCDRESLVWEQQFKDRWLSAKLFSDLERAGVMRPLDMRARINASALPMLHHTGLARDAIATMQSELDTLGSQRERRNLGLPKKLVELNKFIFASLSLELPAAVLYQGKENYFNVRRRAHLPPSAAQIQPTIPSTDVEARQKNFVTALKSVLPDFALLPPLLPGSASAAALRRCMEREKQTVLRYAFGDPTVQQGDILDFRLGPHFRADDAAIDEPRRAQTLANFQLLLQVRDKTRDVRSGVQRILGDVLEGRRIPRDVRTELDIHSRELLSHFPDLSSTKASVRLASGGVLAGLFEAASHIPGPGLVFHAIDYVRARREHQRYQALRHQYPLPFFWRDFHSARAKH